MGAQRRWLQFCLLPVGRSIGPLASVSLGLKPRDVPTFPLRCICETKIRRGVAEGGGILLLDCCCTQLHVVGIPNAVSILLLPALQSLDWYPRHVPKTLGWHRAPSRQIVVPIVCAPAGSLSRVCPPDPVNSGLDWEEFSRIGIPKRERRYGDDANRPP